MSSKSQAKVPRKKVIEEYKLGRSTPGYHVYYNKETDQYIVKSDTQAKLESTTLPKGTNQSKPSTNQESNKPPTPSKSEKNPGNAPHERPRLKQIL